MCDRHDECVSAAPPRVLLRQESRKIAQISMSRIKACLSKCALGETNRVRFGSPGYVLLTVSPKGRRRRFVFTR